MKQSKDVPSNKKTSKLDPAKKAARFKPDVARPKGKKEKHTHNKTVKKDSIAEQKKYRPSKGFIRSLLFVLLSFSIVISNINSRETEINRSLAVEVDTMARIEIVAHERISELKKAKKRAEEERIAEITYQELIKPDIGPFPLTNTAIFIRKINTNKKVVFLTMDDGIVKNPAALTYIRENKLNPTLFLDDRDISDNYDFFKPYSEAGITIQNHTLTHPQLPKLTYAGQKSQICGNADKIQAIYGTRPVLFRPPYGEYNASTQQAAYDCGARFLINWSAKVDGGAVQYQSGNHLVAGDVVLMHFRTALMEDLAAFKIEAESQGLTPAVLSDWLK